MDMEMDTERQISADNLPAPQASHRLPDVVIIGAAKSGSTSLAARLKQHPDIFLSRDKEPEFFSHDHNFIRGWDWYCQNFVGAGEKQLILEASTGYTRSPQHPYAAERLFRYCPDIKLIYLMRHPVDRAFSHFVHRYTKELFMGQPFTRTFEEHVKEDPMCVDSSDYKLQIQKYLEFFPREQLLLLFTHELARDEASVLSKICQFLNIDGSQHYFEASGENRNVTSKFIDSQVRVAITDSIKNMPLVGKLAYALPKPMREEAYKILRKLDFGRKVQQEFTPQPMLPETRTALIKRFRPSNEWVADLTGTDLSFWNQ